MTDRPGGEVFSGPLREAFARDGPTGYIAVGCVFSRHPVGDYRALPVTPWRTNRRR